MQAEGQDIVEQDIAKQKAWTNFDDRYDVQLALQQNVEKNNNITSTVKNSAAPDEDLYHMPMEQQMNLPMKYVNEILMITLLLLITKKNVEKRKARALCKRQTHSPLSTRCAAKFRYDHRRCSDEHTTGVPIPLTLDASVFT